MIQDSRILLGQGLLRGAHRRYGFSNGPTEKKPGYPVGIFVFVVDPATHERPSILPAVPLDCEHSDHLLVAAVHFCASRVTLEPIPRGSVCLSVCPSRSWELHWKVLELLYDGPPLGSVSVASTSTKQRTYPELQTLRQHEERNCRAVSQLPLVCCCPMYLTW